jgi:DNA-directed RNA polymerase specialized sigma24 family protein
MNRRQRVAKATQDNNYVPQNYEDLYRYYILGTGKGASLAHQLIRHFVPHATPDERETLAQDVYVRCQAKDMLKVFDPTKSNFGGVIFFVTRTVCVNHLDRKQRDPQGGLLAGSLVDRDLEDGEFEPGVYSLDRLFGSPAPDHEKRMDAEALVTRLKDWAHSLYVAPRHKRDASLYPLLNLLLEEHNPLECSEQLGVTPSTIHNWLGILRQRVLELKADLGEPA